MFIDSARFTVTSGKGGQGCASFRREKFVVKGGPDGGDGGKGGDVYFLVDNNTDTLSNYKGRKFFKADNGKQGLGGNMTGKSGEPLVLIVPPGTQVIDDETNEVIFDLLELGEKVLFLEGGKGGLGNVHFKNSRNQRPTYFQPGLPGQVKGIRLELKLIADVGLVGYPNVGKSTLILFQYPAPPLTHPIQLLLLYPSLYIIGNSIPAPVTIPAHSFLVNLFSIKGNNGFVFGYCSCVLIALFISLVSNSYPQTWCAILIVFSYFNRTSFFSSLVHLAPPAPFIYLVERTTSITSSYFLFWIVSISTPYHFFFFFLNLKLSSWWLPVSI